MKKFHNFYLILNDTQLFHKFAINFFDWNWFFLKAQGGCLFYSCDTSEIVKELLK